MQKIFILFILSLIISGQKIHAQYYEKNVVDNVTHFIVSREVNKSLLNKDAQILSANKVNLALIKTDEKKTIGKLLINNLGFIEDYYAFDSETETIIQHWRYSYDANNNMTSAYLRAERLRINYTFTYENNLLASIHCDSAGTESQYDFAYENGKILKVTLLDLTKDTVAAKYFFNYDSAGKLESVSDENNETVFFKITYKDNEVTISNGSLFSDSYRFEEERLKSSTRNYHKEFNPKSAVVRKYIIIDNFFYSSNGLIEKIVTNFPAGKAFTQNFEYEFF
jgi:hypothetical protein